MKALAYMDNNKVTALLDDLRDYRAEIYQIVCVLRALVQGTALDATEEVKYGGLLYTKKVPFCGIYAYAKHVTVEFSCGHALNDVRQVLEGQGKLRRHIKITALADIDSRYVKEYVDQAYEKAGT
jgi:hypothetical protein